MWKMDNGELFTKAQPDLKEPVIRPAPGLVQRLLNTTVIAIFSKDE